MLFLEELASHPCLSREDNNTLSSFLTVRSSHQFSAYKTNLSNVLKGFSFITEYTDSHKLVQPNSTSNQIKDYVTGAAFYVKKNLMGLGSDTGPANSSAHP